MADANSTRKSEEEEMIDKAKKIIIESREGEKKKGIFDRLFGKKNEKDIKEEVLLKGFGRDEEVVTDVVATEETAPPAEEKEPTPRQIMAEIEKIHGKLEVERAMRADIESHISEVAEKTGEIRTLVLERDRTFKNIEDEFERFKALIEAVQPEQIRKEINEKWVEMLSFKAKLEILNDQLDLLKKNVEKINTTIENIKSFENLSNILKELDEKISIIEGIKKDVDRNAGKMEAIFLEINKRIIEFEKRKNQIDAMDEILRDTMKNVDMISVKIEKIAKKEDVFAALKDYVKKEDIERLKKYISPEEIEKIREGIKNFDALLEKVKLSEKKIDSINLKSDKLKDSMDAFHDEFLEFKIWSEKMYKNIHDDLLKSEGSTDAIKKTIFTEINKTENRVGFVEENIKEIKKRLTEIEVKLGISEDKGIKDKLKKVFKIHS